MHYYKKSIGDYAKKAGKLSMLEHGAYTLLIDSCYDREKFPTERDAMLWTWARTDEEITAVKFVLNQFFELVDGVYVQNRIKEELAKYRANAKTNKRIATEREEKRKESSRFVGDEHLFEHEPSRSVNEPCTDENEAPPNHKPLNHKPLNKDQEHVNEDVHATVSKPEKYKDEIQNVFEHWKKVMNKRDTVILDSKRKSAIRARLADGYTQDMLCRAVDGCSMTDHNMGRTATNKTLYNDLSLICRDAEHVDRFMATAGKALENHAENTETFVYEPPKPLNDRTGCVSREDAKRFAQEARKQMGAIKK